MIAAFSRNWRLPTCSISRANTAPGAGSSTGGATPDATSALPQREHQRDRQDADRDLGGAPRRHVEPTAISCVGSAHATRCARSRSKPASMMKPSTPMMMMVA